MSASIIIGAIYLTIGIFGVTENVLMAILLSTEGKTGSNPTYYFMTQSCICDALVLLSMAVYTGLALVWNQVQNIIAYRIFAYNTAVGWYAGSGFMILMILSRCVQLTSPQKMETYFSRKLLILFTGLLYCGPLVIFTFAFYYTPLIFTFFPTIFGWEYVSDDLLARTCVTLNMVYNIICVLLVTVFNVKSLLWVRKTRRQIDQALETSVNRKREIKLFIQCAITGIVYAIAAIYFVAVAGLHATENVVQHVATHFIWLSIHLQNPIIYMCVNSKLRKRFWGWVQRFRLCKRRPRERKEGDGSPQIKLTMSELSPRISHTVKNKCYTVENGQKRGNREVI